MAPFSIILVGEFCVTIYSHGHQSLCETTPSELSYDQYYGSPYASPEGVSQL